MTIKRGIIIAVLILMINFSIFLISAEAIGIDVKKNGDDKFNFKLTLYNDNKEKIDGQIDYSIQNFHTEVVQEGAIESGGLVNLQLPKNPDQRPWKIIAKYNDIESNELFNVGDVKRADIKLEGDTLIIENTGNVAYDKNILVTIGSEDQTINVFLSVMQTKRIKLTAPEGQYTIKVDDGENQIVQPGVSLTGNVVGAKSAASGNFWSKYPLIVLFLLSLFLVFVIVSVLKVHNKLSNKSGVTKKKKR